MNPSFNFWQKWMTYVNIMMVIIGVVVAFANETFLFSYYDTLTTKNVLNGQEMDMETRNLKMWLFGIIGGSIVGFHLLIVFVSEFAFKKKERWAYWAILLSVLLWFIIDSSISVVYGAFHNVLLVNLFAIILVGLPLIFTYNNFINSKT